MLILQMSPLSQKLAFLQVKRICQDSGFVTPMSFGLSFPCQSDVSVTVTDPTQNYHLPLFLQLRLLAQKPYVA